MELVDHRVNLLALGFFHSVPEVRPLSSTGVTLLPWYYGPVRHPTRPGLALAGVQLAVTKPPPLGLPVLRAISVYRHAVATTPAGSCWVMSFNFPHEWRPSLKKCQVGSRIVIFRGVLSVHSRYGLPAR
jgi:hypothetical protein